MTELHTQSAHMRDGVKTMRVALPYGIGYVEIRTGNVQGLTGCPLVAVEVVSDTRDKPAQDGLVYEPEVSNLHNTVYLVGYPPEESPRHIHTGCGLDCERKEN